MYNIFDILWRVCLFALLYSINFILHLCFFERVLVGHVPIMIIIVVCILFTIIIIYIIYAIISTII